MNDEEVITVDCTCGYNNTPMAETGCSYCGKPLRKITKDNIIKILELGKTKHLCDVEIVDETTLKLVLRTGVWITMNLIVDLLKYYKGASVACKAEGDCMIIKVWTE